MVIFLFNLKLTLICTKQRGTITLEIITQPKEKCTQINKKYKSKMKNWVNTNKKENADKIYVSDYCLIVRKIIL